ncbi:MAG: S8 family serine peptidase, partial [Proteobacteria bacterium]|nr:S8 family serine peptidase [Pseudomonadota bacterium]
MSLRELESFRHKVTTRDWLIVPNFPVVIAGIAILALALGGCHKVEKSKPSGELMESSSGALYLAHEVVIKKSKGASDDDLLVAVTKVGGTIVDADSPVTKRLGYIRVVLPENIYADQVISSLRKVGSVDKAERNYIAELDLDPDDTLMEELWAIEKIQCDKAWEITTGSNQIVIAVADTGVDRTHPDLQPNIWTNPAEIPGNGVDDDNNGFVDDVHGFDFANGDSEPLDDHGHGTHCSGTIGAVGNNGQGIAGVAWNVKIMALKFMKADGKGSLFDAATAILYAADQGVNIVNASWGCNGCNTAYVADAIEALSQAGGIFVATAGNDTLNIDDYPHYPAAYGYDNIISVAATSPKDQLSSFSNYGQNKVHVAAPGNAIMSTVPGGEYEPWSGTSMAAP